MATNQECANVFTKIADLLEITGANGFKVNAYRKAARSCENESRELGRLARENPAELKSTRKPVIFFLTPLEVCSSPLAANRIT